jgi:hypothetical protein
MATLEAASFAGNPLFHPEHKHPPYTVTEAYWFAKHPWNAELYVDISKTIDKKVQALLKHDCQMVLTVDALVAEARVLGADVSALQGLGPDGHRAVIDAGIRRFCAEIGEQAGMAYAEQFRYEKMGMLDRLLGTSYVEPDFAF